MHGRPLMGVPVAICLLACSGGAAPRAEKAPQPEPVAVEVVPCAEDDRGVECFERRRGACVDQAAGWRFSLEMLGEPFARVHVSELGLLRLDHREATMLGTGAEHWLSCMRGCGAADGAAACIPYRMPASLGFAMEDGCEEQTVDGAPWEGRPTRVMRVTCPSGAGEIRFVPSLAPVKSALIVAGMIHEDDGLAALDGLVVSVKLDDEPLFVLGELADVGCAAFDYPDGHEVLGTPAHFDELERLLPVLDLQFQERAKAMVNAMLEEMFDEIAPQLWERIGRMCLGERAEYDAEKVEDCLARRPEMREPAQALVSEATAPLLEIAGQRLKVAYDLVEEAFAAPLCRHFTAPAEEKSAR